MTEDRFARFIDKLLIGDGCWPWVGSKTNGYGTFWRAGGGQNGRGTMDRAHRVSYEHFIGKIPDGLSVDHLCRNRSCVNPRHLDPVTASENSRRGIPGGFGKRLFCESGRHGWRQGQRACRECVYINQNERRRRRRSVKGEP